ncbi:hypothetical protein [Hyalangium gracile]|uniref:hypothetical protein n=1 Tax=Hyalangium gracile TaxID=394092 RepID=UPI001CC9F6C2|nr:hypothetical protein [Hyalangium gracile]
MTLQPEVIGEGAAVVALALVTFVLSFRRMFSTWTKSQAEAREKERKEQSVLQARERAKARRTLRNAVRTELRGLIGRLEKLEHAVDGLMQRQQPQPPAAPQRRAAKRDKP